MKRNLSLLLAVLFFTLASCGRAPAVDTADPMDTPPETDIGMPQQDSGDHQTPDNGQTQTDTPPQENAGNNDINGVPDTVDSVNSADDAVRFISRNLYSLCSEVLPMAVETRVLDLQDAYAVQYNTGLTATEGITDIIISESAVGSFAYSLVYVRTDGKNTEQIHQSLKDSIDPRKWVCVEAEAVHSVRLDDDICIIMGSAEQVDTISTSLRQAAEGIFDRVGDPITVL
ncbi:MAG: hypothetical protein IKY52_00800 [Clostridia bacterium]|nr:hypothetical protein [Clostridia bacterium]